MTPTETNNLMAHAYAQWPHIHQTPQLIDVWHTQLAPTDKRLAHTALNELLAHTTYPPTIAQLRATMTSIIRRNQLETPTLHPGPGPPVTQQQERCTTACDYCQTMIDPYTTTEWANLTRSDRIRIIRQHIHHKLNLATGPLTRTIEL